MYLSLQKLNIKVFNRNANIISIVRQMGHCMGGNFNIHIWAWSSSQGDNRKVEFSQPRALSHVLPLKISYLFCPIQ